MAPSVVLFLRSSETIPRPFEKALPATPKKTKRVCHCGVSRRPTGREAALRQQTETAPARLSEVAILYRANFQSRALEEAMLRYNIPYQVLGVKFFERKEIKDT